MQPADAVSPSGRPGWTARLVIACQDLRGRRLPWLATGFGCGVGGYFALPAEPSTPALGGVVLICLALLALARWRWGDLGFLPLLLATLLLGGIAAQIRTAAVSGPVLPFRYYGPVEGRVVAIDRSASGAVRLTLDRVRLEDFGPDRTPRRVRISLQDPVAEAPLPGARVMTTAHLTPPSGPTEPGGFDFQRHAWFLKLGAVGYTRVPLLQSGPPEDGWGTAIARLRRQIGAALLDRMEGAAGGVAVAITTGDRSFLPAEAVEALRASNLAHLLAISGLHMGLLVGFTFWAVRGGLALVPRLALHHPTRAWAAAAAFPVALAYLAISGGGVATQRAFIMAAVMLGAILVGQRALSIRSVAIAAVIVLVLRPEALTGPGFQMSFAATGALVLAFRRIARLDTGRWMRGWRGAVLALLVSSVVAGAATAPFAAAHFNRLGQLGVLANLLAVPAMGTLVMPMLLIGVMLLPLGLEGVPFWIAGAGIDWILRVAEWVAGLPGSVRTVAAPQPVVLPLLGLGMAVMGAAAGRGRLVGAAIVAAGLLIWSQATRPAVLISDDARLVGVLGPEGRWLSRDRGAGFTARVWLENDGDPADQARAAARDRPRIAGLPPIATARGKRDLPPALEACRRDGGWLVAPEVEVPTPPGCLVIDTDALRDRGALAVWRNPDGTFREVAARDRQGARPWVPTPGR